MADDNTPQDTPATDTPPPSATDDQGLGDAGKQALDRMKAERNDAQRQLKQLQRELEQARTAQMNDSERATAEAVTKARAEERGTWAQRLAAAQFVALAARRNADFDAQAVLDDLNLARYVGDDGEPDEKALGGVVERLVPSSAPNPRPSGDADLGPRPVALNADPRQRARAQIEADLAASRRK